MSNEAKTLASLELLQINRHHNSEKSMADLHITIPLLIENINDTAALQKSIAEAIMENQDDSHPLLERLIDMGDARDMSVVERSLNIEYCDVGVSMENMKGIAHGMFDSDYYASCKDIETMDDHKVTLPFTIEEDTLVFNIDLPETWLPM